MKGTENLIFEANSHETFREEAHKLVDLIADHLKMSHSEGLQKTIGRIPPEEQLGFWREDFKSKEPMDLQDFWSKVFSRSINVHSRGYLGHQISVPLPLTALTSAAIGYMNNSTTVYELAMVGNTMEKVIIEHLAGKFGYDGDSEGFVTSGGSLGNLTALLKARSSSGIDSKDYSRLAIMVSEEAHYSVERAASILGVSRENIVKVPSDESFRIRTDLLEGIYSEAVSAGKLVFCVVGCACTTSVGAYDDLAAIADFARTHGIWFHVDGAHGGVAVFSDKYRHYLDGIEHSDSLVLDFHKMMLVPSISTAVIFNARNRGANAFSPKADYLWQAGGAGAWYDSAKHTLECTKPISVLHAYAIMRVYGEEIYRQHVDKLYDLGRSFADMVKGQAGMELAVEPSCNIVCFRCLSGAGEDGDDRLNKRIYEELLEEGLFYIVSTTIRGRFYLRVSLMNPMTDAETLEELLKDIVKRTV